VRRTGWNLFLDESLGFGCDALTAQFLRNCSATYPSPFQGGKWSDSSLTLGEVVTWRVRRTPVVAIFLPAPSVSLHCALCKLFVQDSEIAIFC